MPNHGGRTRADGSYRSNEVARKREQMHRLIDQIPDELNRTDSMLMLAIFHTLDGLVQRLRGRVQNPWSPPERWRH